MRTLLHTIIWCPEDQPKRQEGLKKHLTRLLEYKDYFEILITVNSYPGPQVKAILDQFLRDADLSRIIIEYFNDNKGWAWARNRAIKHTIENGFDLLIMMDGDIWVEDDDWIMKVQKASTAHPVFMCRMKEPQYMKGGKLKYMGEHWELYDEWLGCINVARAYVLKQIGGYNHEDLPNLWGFHDCLWGRQLMAAGHLKPFTGLYPSLAGLGVIEEQDKDYDATLDTLKHEAVNKWNPKFCEVALDILNGKRDYFFDYTYQQ